MRCKSALDGVDGRHLHFFNPGNFPGLYKKCSRESIVTVETMCTQSNACEMSIVHVANVAGWVTSGVSYTELRCLPHTAKLAIGHGVICTYWRYCLVCADASILQKKNGKITLGAHTRGLR